jgi:hypothetical protein
MYPGTSGNTQGDRKDSSPPIKAIAILKRDTPMAYRECRQFPKPKRQIQIYRLAALPLDA